MSYAIKVIDEDNDEEGFVCDGMSDHPTRYLSKKDAQDFVEFMRIGMDEKQQGYKLIVVPYPEKRKGERK